jgi:protein TonB
MDNSFHAPTKIPHEIHEITTEAAPSSGVAGMSGMGGGSAGGALGGIMGAIGTGPAIVVQKAKPTGPIRVSSGVATGNLINKIQPIYPAIAKAAHVQGTVILHAIISKTGTIDNLTVESGPPMLRQAAIDGVRQWRYKPYLLNGEPTEVDTTITVNFTTGG